MSDQTDEQMIPTPSDFGHFLLQRELGHGGMGGVYLAHDKMLDRQVGIKVMLKSLGDDPAFVERFQREAQAAARLNHPNIAQIYSFGKENGMPYIAMELVSGGSLDKEMEQNPGTLDPVHVMRVGQQLADALALAADQGLVHGDVKPENVLYDADGNAKLVDFGLAAMQGDSNEIWGTPYYISPEKVRRQKIDFRADIYSLGGTLYHALTGVAPFEGEDATEVVKARFQGPPRRPSEVRPDIPPEIDTIIMRMLEVEPSMRYPTYQSLLGDFKRYLSKAGPAKKPGKAAGPKVKIKGTKINLKLTAEASAAGAPLESAGDLEPVDGEAPEEKKPLNLGLVVAGVAGGIVLLVLLVVGGLLWYVHAEKERERREAHQQLVDMQTKARSAIQTTVKAIGDYGDRFHELMAKSEKDFSDQLRQLKAAIPADMKEASAAFVDVPPSRDVEDAVAFTNQLFAAAAAQAEAEAQAAANATNATGTAAANATNATETAAAATNGAPAVAAAAAPAPEEKKPAAAKDDGEQDDGDSDTTLPSGIRQFAEVWADVYACRAADIRVQGSVQVLLLKAAKAEKLTNEDEETVRALGKLSTQLVEGLDQIKSMKCVELAQRKVSAIRQKSVSLVRTAKDQIRRIQDKAERARKAAEEKARQEEKAKRLAAEKKEKSEAETKLAKESFERMVSSRLRYLEWDKALSDLRKVYDGDITTPDGREEMRAQIYKVECMQAFHKLLIEALGKFCKEGERDAKEFFKFRDETVVTAVDEKGLTLRPVKYVKGKKVQDREHAVEWRRFYGKPEHVGKMSQLINSLALQGRDTLHTPPLPWSRQMLGAALTLQLLYTEAKGAADFAPVLVKKAAKEFEDCQKWVKKWWPDLDLEAE